MQEKFPQPHRVFTKRHCGNVKICRIASLAHRQLHAEALQAGALL